jgi:hypothetical protein
MGGFTRLCPSTLSWTPCGHVSAQVPQLMQASDLVTLYFGTWCLNLEGIFLIVTVDGFIRLLLLFF